MTSALFCELRRPKSDPKTKQTVSQFPQFFAMKRIFAIANSVPGSACSRWKFSFSDFVGLLCFHSAKGDFKPLPSLFHFSEYIFLVRYGSSFRCRGPFCNTSSFITSCQRLEISLSYNFQLITVNAVEIV